MKSVKQLLGAKGAQIFSVRPESKVIDALRLMAEKTSARWWCWKARGSSAYFPSETMRGR